MATITSLEEISLGGTETLYIFTAAADSSYPTGGEALDLSANRTLKVVLCQPTSGYVFQWDAANQKLLAYQGDNDNAADAPLVQVPNATDLSALTDIRGIAIGS